MPAVNLKKVHKKPSFKGTFTMNIDTIRSTSLSLIVGLPDRRQNDKRLKLNRTSVRSGDLVGLNQREWMFG